MLRARRRSRVGLARDVPPGDNRVIWQHETLDFGHSAYSVTDFRWANLARMARVICAVPAVVPAS